MQCPLTKLFLALSLKMDDTIRMNLTELEQVVEALPEAKKSEFLKHLLKTHLLDLKTWLSAGERIQVVACLTFVQEPKESESENFTAADIARMRARLRKRCGGRILTAEESAAIIRESRGDDE